MINDLSGAEWFKSSFSGADKNCVEVAFLDDGGVGIRDSKNRTGPALAVESATWDAFTAAVATGRFSGER